MMGRMSSVSLKYICWMKFPHFSNSFDKYFRIRSLEIEGNAFLISHFRRYFPSLYASSKRRVASWRPFFMLEAFMNLYSFNISCFSSLESFICPSWVRGVMGG